MTDHVGQATALLARELETRREISAELGRASSEDGCDRIRVAALNTRSRGQLKRAEVLGRCAPARQSCWVVTPAPVVWPPA